MFLGQTNKNKLVLHFFLFLLQTDKVKRGLIVMVKIAIHNHTLQGPEAGFQKQIK